MKKAKKFQVCIEFNIKCVPLKKHFFSNFVLELFRPRFLNSESPVTFGTRGWGGIGNINKNDKKI